MKKIVYVPLDGRPCNFDDPKRLFHGRNLMIERMDDALLGDKHTPAETGAIASWLKKAVRDADGLVVSLDMLLYGGLVPSRRHRLPEKTLRKRLSVIPSLKAIRPGLVIYAFQTILRCPGYDGSDAEPEYFKAYGKAIFRHGWLKHKIESGQADADEIEAFHSLSIPQAHLDDFIARRNINVGAIMTSLGYLKQGDMDALVIAQDDSAPYGWTAMDQDKIRAKIRELSVRMKTFMYPGADEVGMTLMARMLNHMHDKTPKVYVKYPSVTSPAMIPNIEDRHLDVMVKYHITVSGGLVATSLDEADAVLFVNAPADHMLSSLRPEPPGPGMTVLRNMPEAMRWLGYVRDDLGKPVIIADVTHGNGSNLDMYRWLDETGMVFDVAAYGGWNTASNAIGGAVAQGMLYLREGKTKKHMEFLMLRYVEDIAYQGYVRQAVRDVVLHGHPAYSYDDVGATDQEVAAIVRKRLRRFIDDRMKTIASGVIIHDVTLPWRRMYEARIDLSLDSIPST